MFSNQKARSNPGHLGVRDMSVPALLIPGASVRDAATAARRDEAYLAMQAAVEIGQYFLAERIRREHLLMACSLCGTCKPPSHRGHDRLRWTTVTEFLDDLHLLICWECIARIDINTEHWSDGWPNGDSHNCHLIHRHRGLNLPEQWLCELP